MSLSLDDISEIPDFPDVGLETSGSGPSVVEIPIPPQIPERPSYPRRNTGESRGARLIELVKAMGRVFLIITHLPTLSEFVAEYVDTRSTRRRESGGKECLKNYLMPAMGIASPCEKLHKKLKEASPRCSRVSTPTLCTPNHNVNRLAVQKRNQRLSSQLTIAQRQDIYKYSLVGLFGAGVQVFELGQRGY